MQLVPVFGGTLTPFRLSWPQQEAFAHPSWERAKQAALESVARGEPTLLVGQPGTGKTLLLRSLDRILRERGFSVREFRPGDPQEKLAAGDVLLIDEAGLLATDELERICRLPNAFVMAGLPNLLERLPFCPRAVGRVTLEPLGPEEIARFIRSRLAACGLPRGLFTSEAVVALARHSAGLFRLVIILASAAVFLAEQRGSAEVAVSDVDDAMSMRAAMAEEAEQDASLGEAISGEEVSDEEASGRTPAASALEAEPAWLRAVVMRSWQGRRPVAIAGLIGWASASLAIVVLAIMAARSVRPIPRLALQEIQRASSPMLASAAEPDPSLEPEVLVAPSSPVQVMAALPPAPLPSALPPSPEPAAPLETARARAAIPLPHPVPSASQPASQLWAPEAAERPTTVLAYSGPIMNETMGQGGQLSLQLSTSRPRGVVGALFHASHGLIGTGVLKGEIGPGGRITLSGRLMMGRNPFDCALQATLEGDRLVGEATFARPTTGTTAHSSFRLSRL